VQTKYEIWVEGKYLPLLKHVTDAACSLKAAMVKNECSYTSSLPDAFNITLPYLGFDTVKSDRSVLTVTQK
jgi:hypothetical protein